MIFILAWITTNIFSVECTPCIIMLAYFFESSRRAKWLALNFIVMNILAQIPKRICFRNRPWRLRLGKVFVRDQTSGFPSRTTLISSVFVFAILIDLDNPDFWFVFKISLIANLLTA